MRCDSQASFLARTLANLCLGHEPKARVATTNMKRDTLIKYKEVVIVCEENEHFSLSYNVLLTTP
jgi:hypothetical protein